MGKGQLFLILVLCLGGGLVLLRFWWLRKATILHQLETRMIYELHNYFTLTCCIGNDLTYSSETYRYCYGRWPWQWYQEVLVRIHRVEADNKELVTTMAQKCYRTVLSEPQFYRCHVRIVVV